MFGATHLMVAGFAVLMQLGKGKRAWQYAWIIPLTYVLVAGIEALLSGSIVGLMSAVPSPSKAMAWGVSSITNSVCSLGAVYSAGYFKMSTWIPFVWGGINTLVLILSSFSFQGGL
jgi:hypothetical protein